MTIDREGHGNYENTGDTNALMATNGMYDSVKYLYNLDYVDKSKIGISGHSMGGMTTAATLMQDAANGYNLVAAGLMQAWSSFMGAGAGVDVGFLKAKDDEFSSPPLKTAERFRESGSQPNKPKRLSGTKTWSAAFKTVWHMSAACR